ncbi:MAG: hypothetical protein ACE5R6_03020 [Candidatus Heimdallarchaeota archaeon]
MEIGDPDGDNQDEIVAGSWDSNIYLFENIYNGTYYNAWSSPDLTHVETGKLTLYAPLVISGFVQAPSRSQSVFISTTAGIPFTYREYDEAIDMVVGNTDGDEAAEIIIATTRSILVFENRATPVNPNSYELVWRGDFQIDAKYEISALTLGDDLDGDGAPEIIVLVGNKLYVLESAELYVPPELVQPYQPVLNITNPKLGPIFAEPIDVSPIVTQPDQPIVVQPIIPQPVEPIVQPQPGPGIQTELQQKSQQQIPIIQPSKLQPATQLKLIYNHYIVTSVLDVPDFDNTLVTQMITEDLDLDGRGEIILAGISLTGVYHLAMMTHFNGVVRCLEAVANDDYREKWTVTPPFGVTAIAVDDQDGNGRKELICGSYGITIFEHTGVDDGIVLKQSTPSDTIGWVGALGVGNSDGDNRREILVAATNVSESGPNLPRNIISVLELEPGTTFLYELVYNTAFREPVNVGDMAIGDTNNNGYDEIICSAPGGFTFSYEYAVDVEVTEIFLVAQYVYPVYSPVYREATMIEEAEQLQSVEETVPLYNATLIQQPFYPIG